MSSKDCLCERPEGARVITHLTVFASDRRERGNLVLALRLFYEIASALRASQRQRGGKVLRRCASRKDKEVEIAEVLRFSNDTLVLSLRATGGSVAISYLRV